jgi:hypothetical protein
MPSSLTFRSHFCRTVSSGIQQLHSQVTSRKCTSNPCTLDGFFLSPYLCAYLPSKGQLPSCVFSPVLTIWNMRVHLQYSHSMVELSLPLHLV